MPKPTQRPSWNHASICPNCGARVIGIEVYGCTQCEWKARESGEPTEEIHLVDLMRERQTRADEALLADAIERTGGTPMMLHIALCVYRTNEDMDIQPALDLIDGWALANKNLWERAEHYRRPAQTNSAA